MRIRSLYATTAAAATALSLVSLPAAATGGQSGLADNPSDRTYEVTVTNRTFGQPISPVAAVTHRNAAIDLIGRRAPASEAIRAIAEDGDASVAVATYEGAAGVTDVVVGAPIAPLGVRADAPITATSHTFTITARPGDRLSLAGMLICTNDGFTGIDNLRLPNKGARLFHGRAYDAGTELNTELSADLVDPCSGLGPVVLEGDANGNNNAGIDEDGVVGFHPNVDGTVGDLLPAHAWTRAPISVRVERVG